ncbi:GNAT family N-acetyltransferase [Rhodococcus sp. NPDC058505]|uniref:GNAT family N-acetyltransferase n=1 Tax=unclassified Rhodococcus (in: high G+C Gram-positive bacteria) TaxID=192944 RepID=UPI0036693CF3
MIRLAIAADLSALPAIEVAAGHPFRALGMTAVADDAPPTIAGLERYRRAGRLWVATAASPASSERKRSVDEIDRMVHSLARSQVGRSDGTAVGYACAEVVDGGAHLEQVSVDPRWSGRRLGAALIEAVAAWAVDRGDRRLTLTTFVDVPWNAPYYRRLGFEPIPDSDLGPQLRAVRAAEAAHGLDAWPRIAMQRPLNPSHLTRTP